MADQLPACERGYALQCDECGHLVEEWEEHDPEECPECDDGSLRRVCTQGCASRPAPSREGETEAALMWIAFTSAGEPAGYATTRAPLSGHARIEAYVPHALLSECAADLAAEREQTRRWQARSDKFMHESVDRRRWLVRCGELLRWWHGQDEEQRRQRIELARERDEAQREGERLRAVLTATVGRMRDAITMPKGIREGALRSWANEAEAEAAGKGTP